MKNKENENQESNEEVENRRLQSGSSGGFSIFNDNYPTFLGFDLVQHLPEDPLPKKEKKEKPTSYLDDPEALKAIEPFKAYSTKIKPPME